MALIRQMQSVEFCYLFSWYLLLIILNVFYFLTFLTHNYYSIETYHCKKTEQLSTRIRNFSIINNELYHHFSVELKNTNALRHFMHRTSEIYNLFKVNWKLKSALQVWFIIIFPMNDYIEFSCHSILSISNNI